MEFESSVIEISDFSSEVVGEDELPLLLQGFEAQAVKFIESENYGNAVVQLKRLEETMESVLTQGGSASVDCMVATLHNLAFCYQQLGEAAKVKVYIDACVFNAKSVGFMRRGSRSAEFSIKKAKYICKTSLVYAEILRNSDMKKTEKILGNAQACITKALQETFKSCKRLLNHYKSKEKLACNKVEQGKILLTERAFPALESINEYLLKGILKKVRMRSALGIRSMPEWLNEFKLEDITRIIAVQSEEFTVASGIQTEFTKDAIVYKVLLLAACMFYRGEALNELGDAKQGLRLLQNASHLALNFFPRRSAVCQQLSHNLACQKALKSSQASNPNIRRNLSVDFSAKLNHIKL